jgi:hypothetical protein
MTFGSKVLEFYKGLRFPDAAIPDGIEVMIPMKDRQIEKLNELFYNKYYDDNKKRIFLIGINPGRFGGGITGIPFTDPVHLAEVLNIDSPLAKKHELSSKFIYEVVHVFGGPKIFFEKCYLTAVSPLGFVCKGRNINYYDDEAIINACEDQFVYWLKKQIEFGANTEVAFSLGRGKNYKFLKDLNRRFDLFHLIKPLPHPRWVMQYRYPERKHFVDYYVKQISEYK